MAEGGVCLGICYADNQLFYAVNNPEENGSLRHIGCFDFNFDVKNAIVSGDGNSFSGIQSSLNKLKETYSCETVRILSPAVEECWSIFPRAVYESPDEREAHLSLLMSGVDRSNLQSTWYEISNNEYKLLTVRNSDTMQGFQSLLGSFRSAEYVSEFELGSEWQSHTNVNGSFLMVHCQRDYLSVASFILGKLRGGTVIRFENRTDLPYLWSLYSSKHQWMSGIHEQVYVFGQFARETSEILTPFWDDTGEVLLMNTLEQIRAAAPEETYGFRLESAFPAVMLSLNTAESNKQADADHNG